MEPQETQQKWERWTATLSPELKDQLKAAVEASGQTQAEFLAAALAAWRREQSETGEASGEIRQVRGSFASALALVEAVLIRATNQETQAAESVKAAQLAQVQERAALAGEIQGLKDRIGTLEADNARLAEAKESRELLKEAHEQAKAVWEAEKAGLQSRLAEFAGIADEHIKLRRELEEVRESHHQASRAAQERITALEREKDNQAHQHELEKKDLVLESTRQIEAVRISEQEKAVEQIQYIENRLAETEARHREELRTLKEEAETRQREAAAKADRAEAQLQAEIRERQEEVRQIRTALEIERQARQEAEKSAAVALAKLEAAGLSKEAPPATPQAKKKKKGE